VDDAFTRAPPRVVGELTGDAPRELAPPSPHCALHKKPSAKHPRPAAWLTAAAVMAALHISAAVLHSIAAHELVTKGRMARATEKYALAAAQVMLLAY
jgi:hypothetical protein